MFTTYPTVDLTNTQLARKFKKVQAKKNSSNQINHFHEIFCWPTYIFCHFKNGRKINFWTRKKFKIAKNVISRKKIWFHEFFCLDFFKCSGPLWLTLEPEIWKTVLSPIHLQILISSPIGFIKYQRVRPKLYLT